MYIRYVHYYYSLDTYSSGSLGVVTCGDETLTSCRVFSSFYSLSSSSMISRATILGLTTAAVVGGTLYSYINNTYLDTSDPLLAHLPHPLHHQSIFAQKSNIFNTVFIKKAWGWTSLAFLALWLTSPPQHKSRNALAKWIIATCIWGSFVMWFFGPGLFDRLWVASGGECLVLLPDGHDPSVLKVPLEYCMLQSTVSPQTHPNLFASAVGADRIEPLWKARARIYRGHDVSGHIFLLTLSILFLHDQLQPAWRNLASGRFSNPPIYKAVVAFSTLLMSLWLFMTLTTSVYWHSPLEKLSGLVIGLGGFVITQLPSRLQNSEDSSQTWKED